MKLADTSTYWQPFFRKQELVHAGRLVLTGGVAAANGPFYPGYEDHSRAAKGGSGSIRKFLNLSVPVFFPAAHIFVYRSRLK